MKKLIILILIIVFLAGCVNQNNITSSSTAPEENVETNQSSNASTTLPSNVSTPTYKTYDVAIRNFVYSLTITTIKVGDSVTWTNFDVVDHSATSDDGIFDTGLLSEGESRTVTFNETGTYNYHCTSHTWMTGKIIVK